MDLIDLKEIAYGLFSRYTSEIYKIKTEQWFPLIISFHKLSDPRYCIRCARRVITFLRLQFSCWYVYSSIPWAVKRYPGAGGIRALRCLTQNGENRCQYIRYSYCSSFPARSVAWERKMSARDNVFGWPVNREIPCIFSRYDTTRPRRSRLSVVFHGTDGNRDPV